MVSVRIQHVLLTVDNSEEQQMTISQSILLIFVALLWYIPVRHIGRHLECQNANSIYQSCHNKIHVLTVCDNEQPKLHHYFLFRKIDPENQLVNISMELAPNTVIQPHLESHQPRLHNWLTLKLHKYFLFRKFAPKGMAWQLCSKNGNDDASKDRWVMHQRTGE